MTRLIPKSLSRIVIAVAAFVILVMAGCSNHSGEDKSSVTGTMATRLNEADRGRMKKEALQGITSMLVVVEIHGIDSLSEDVMTKDVEDKLSACGIKIVHGYKAPAGVPILLLKVDAIPYHIGSDDLVLYTGMVYISEVFPENFGKGPDYVVGIVWDYTYHGVVPTPSLSKVRGILNDELIGTFVKDFKAQNPR